MYNWQNTNWPNFSYALSAHTQQQLYDYALEAGKFTGLLEETEKPYQQEIILEIMVLEAQKTSEIEGEIIHAEEIRSSLRHHLGIDAVKNLATTDKRALGISNLLFECRNTFSHPLTEESLHTWHKMVMQGGCLKPHEIGKFRCNPEPMQIVSGAIGREIVYFEAPPSNIMHQEMGRFIEWFNTPLSTISGPVRAAIAHLYFESIHPYMDGNGRIGRSLSEKVLSQDLNTPILFSISNALMKNRKQYYQMLHENSRDSLDISAWVSFFIEMIIQAQSDSKKQITFVIQKAKFWKKYATSLNQRQQKVIQRMFAEGVKGFIGGISASKYMKITDTSKATATRDLTNLVAQGCLRKLSDGGRNTHYDLNL